MQSTYLNYDNDVKLINFNAPRHLMTNFDNLLKFKRVSRTSMLIHLIDRFIRNEIREMEIDNTLNVMIDEVSNRNRKDITETIKRDLGARVSTDERLNVDRQKDYWEPPVVPSFDDDDDDGWRL